MSRHWMPFYIADYLADTSHLTTAEHGAYMLLIMHYWTKGELSNDDKRLASIVRATPDAWAQLRPVLAEFFSDDWRHERIERELVRTDKAYQQKLAASQKGVEARAKAKPSGQPNGKPSDEPYGQLTTTTTTLEPVGSSERGPVGPSRASRLPKDFAPSIDEAEGLGLSKAQAEREVAKFKDYWISQPASRALKADWPATWRNWVRRAVENQPTTRSTSPPARKRNFADVAMDKLRSDENGTESVFGSNGDVELLSPGKRQPRSDIEHVRGGIAGRYLRSLFNQVEEATGQAIERANP